MLLHTFTRREKLLMVVLAVVMLLGVYILAVHYPVRDSLAQLEQERADLELNLQIAQARYGQYQTMKDELADILSRPADQITVMPDYDNLQPLMSRLNQIFSPAISYEMSFDPVLLEGTVARRTIRVTFTCAAYQETRSILEQLCRTGWRCLISELSLSPVQNVGDLSNSAVAATVTVTFFEQTG